MLQQKLNPGQQAMADSVPVVMASDQTDIDVTGTELAAIQAAVEDTDTGYTPLGAHTTISSLSSAQTITPAAGATKVIMQAFTQNVRYRLDGGTPTAATGFQLPAGTLREVPVGNGSTIKVIEETASASLQYQAVG